MKPLELAKKYMAIVFENGDLEKLTDILAADCSFEGPFYQFKTAQVYIDSLKESPPTDFHYKMLYAFEDSTTACLVYTFSKSTISTPMTQLFEVKDSKIKKILLVFDTRAFEE